ncbi:MAG: hypothetical protein ACOCYO_03455, partial [Bacteroidota bacterium]
MRNFFPVLASLIILLLILQFSSCRKDDFDTSPSVKLSFSTDSLLFDTVFTTIGSSTRYFKVYNRHSSDVMISDLRLAGGKSSFFRINANGSSGTHIKDIEIGANDSIYVFVEVTVDPVGEKLPLVITDSVVFNTNNNQQDVKLVAWGQDANFIRPNFSDTINDIDYHLITRNTTWSGIKPWIVYGLVVVAPEASLTIEKGSQIHFHNNSAMIFMNESSLKIEGTAEEQVFLQGDRLENDYSDLPGQWGYIWLTAGSTNHSIENAVIKNATYGVIMDSIGSFTEPTLRMHNTIIKNMDQTGLELRGAWVEATNLVVANCGVSAINMMLGGNYNFKHITVGNYYSLPGTIRQTPSLTFNNYYVDTSGVVQVRDFEQVYFGNSIIYGSLTEEIALDLYPDNSNPDFVFDHCLVRTAIHNQFPERFTNSLTNQQPRFVEAQDNNYRLRNDSPARKKGSKDIALQVPLDILGRNRTDTVDIGAYQY